VNDSPFAHRIARTPKKITPATDERRTTPVLIAHMPLTDDDLSCEQETTPVARPDSDGMRQTIVAVIAFIATTLVLLLAVLVWKTVFGK
jgi:hypothetical protein